MSDDTGDTIAIALVTAGVWAGGWWIGGSILTILLMIDICTRVELRGRKQERDQ